MGSFAYSHICAAINLYFIHRLWAARQPGEIEPMVNIGLGNLLYALGGLARGDVWDFCCGTLYFFAGAIFMVARVGGWGHSLMHICLGGQAHHILNSACNLLKA